MNKLTITIIKSLFKTKTHHKQKEYLNKNVFKLLLKILREALFLNCNVDVVVEPIKSCKI